MGLLKVLKKKFLLSIEKVIKYNNLQLLYKQKVEILTNKALFSVESGISNQKVCDFEVIVSLTTFGRRLYDVYLPIESIMQGSMKPNKICLWISEELKNEELPITLQRQQKRGLEIHFCKDIRSYTKLIPALQFFPNACIITIDDDLIYDFDLVEKLVNSFKKDPQFIHANRIHRVILGKDNKPISYLKWNLCADYAEASFLNFLTGVGGVLYPPHALNNEVFNDEVFLDICKYADDIWFYAMALLNNTKIKKCYTHNPKGEEYIINEIVQESGLNRRNTSKAECLNDLQLSAVFDRYNLYDKLIE